MARRRIKARIHDLTLLGEIFYHYRLHESNFFRSFDIEEGEMQPVLAISAMLKAEKEDTAVHPDEWKSFQFYYSVD
jgi:hypothetical protein